MFKQLLANPFLLYSTLFSIVLLSYLLNLSDLYPELSSPTVIFLLITIGASILVGILLRKTYKRKMTVVYNSGYKYAIACTTVLIAMLTLLEIYVMGSIPLIAIASKVVLSKKTIDEFGLPLIHPLILTMSSFVSVLSFVIGRYFNKKCYYLFILLNLMPSILYFSRGTLFITGMSILFVYFILSKSVSLRMMLSILVVIITGCYLFGYLGNLRLGSRELILSYGKYNYSYNSGIVFSELFWTYLYLTTPLANFQLAVQVADKLPLFIASTNYLSFEVLPAFFSKYLELLLNITPYPVDYISPVFNVGSIYSRPFVGLGWPGAYIMFVQIICYIYVVTKLTKRSDLFGVIGLAFLNCSVLMMVFDNSIVFTGTLFPILFSMLLQKPFIKTSKVLDTMIKSVAKNNSPKQEKL